MTLLLDHICDLTFFLLLDTNLLNFSESCQSTIETNPIQQHRPIIRKMAFLRRKLDIYVQ
jgi:hypothetical protein